LLGVEEVWASPVSIARAFSTPGTAGCRSPPPASVELLKGVPTVEIGVEGEIATLRPHGCAVLATLAKGFGRQRADELRQGGVSGAGDAEFPGLANFLRCVHRREAWRNRGRQALVMETNLDDLSPQVVGALMTACSRPERSTFGLPLPG